MLTVQFIRKHNKIGVLRWCLLINPQNNNISSVPVTVRYIHQNYTRRVANTEAVCPSTLTGNNDISESQSDFQASSSKYLTMDDMPGPRGLKRVPYLGSLLLFWPFSKYRPETYGHLVGSLHDKYGPVFKTRLGKGYTVHTSAVEDVEKVYDSDGQYPMRRLMMLSRMYRLRRGLPQALGTVNGEEWYELRKPLNLLLNRPQACLSYLPAQNKVAEDFVSKLAEINNDTPAKDIYELFFRFSSESIGVVCFNERLGFFSDNVKSNPEKQRLLNAFHTSLNCTFKAIIGVERRFMRTADDPFYKKYANAMDYIRKQSAAYVQKVTSNLRQHPTTASQETAPQGDSKNTEGDSDNLLASLIRRADLNMEQILAIIDSLLIAGSDSTARNLSVLLYNLACHPEVQNQAAQEVIGLIGSDGPVTAQSLGQMNYLKACVKESMRLYYPITTGPERILSRDTIISGYLVPKGTSVIISGNKTSVDPKFFPDPLAYKPDRWLRTGRGPASPSNNKSTNTDGDPTHQPHPEVELQNAEDAHKSLKELNPRLCSFAFIPFGHGPRSCIGRRFAELELYVCVARLLQKLEIHVDPSFEGMKTIYTPFITPLEPIPFRFRERESKEANSQ